MNTHQDIVVNSACNVTRWILRNTVYSANLDDSGTDFSEYVQYLDLLAAALWYSGASDISRLGSLLLIAILKENHAAVDLCMHFVTAVYTDICKLHSHTMIWKIYDWVWYQPNISNLITLVVSWEKITESV